MGVMPKYFIRYINLVHKLPPLNDQRHRQILHDTYQAIDKPDEVLELDELIGELQGLGDVSVAELLTKLSIFVYMSMDKTN